MCDIDESDAKALLDIFELNLHILAQLEVKSAERLIEQEHSGVNGERARDGDSLLLTAGERIYISLVEALEVHELKHLFNSGFYLFFGQLFDTQTKRHILINIQMRKERVSLEYRIDLPLVRGKRIDFFAVKNNLTLVGVYEARNNPQGSGFTAARRTQQGNKLLVTNVKVKIFKHLIIPV